MPVIKLNNAIFLNGFKVAASDNLEHLEIARARLEQSGLRFLNLDPMSDWPDPIAYAKALKHAKLAPERLQSCLTYKPMIKPNHVTDFCAMYTCGVNGRKVQSWLLFDAETAVSLSSDQIDDNLAVYKLSLDLKLDWRGYRLRQTLPYENGTKAIEYSAFLAAHNDVPDFELDGFTKMGEHNGAQIYSSQNHVKTVLERGKNGLKLIVFNSELSQQLWLEFRGLARAPVVRSTPWHFFRA